MSDEPPPNLGVLLFIAYRSMETRVLDALAQHGHDLPESQARIFQRIDAQGSRLGELARAAQVSKQTVGSIVDQLERAGYVCRVPDPRDARARLVRIADRGQDLVRISEPVVRQIEAEWQAHLGRARTEQLRDALTALRVITDPFAPAEADGGGN